jgi:hypothetical protein
MRRFALFGAGNRNANPTNTNPDAAAASLDDPHNSSEPVPTTVLRGFGGESIRTNMSP